MTTQNKAGMNESSPSSEASRICVHFNLQLFHFKCGMNTYETELTRRLLRYRNIEVDPFYIHRVTLKSSDVEFPVRHIHFPRFLTFRNNVMKLPLRLVSCAFRIFEPFVSFNFITGTKSEDTFVFFENDMPTLPLKGKVIAVLHDIIPLSMNDFKGASERNFRKRAESIIRNADRVVTVSEYSKREIIDKMNADPSRVDVVYNAVNAEIFSRDKANSEYLMAIRNKYGLPDKYILHFGSCLPQKNIPTLIKAYSMLPENVRNEYRLMITNPDDEVIECARKNRVSDNMLYADHIPDGDKAGLYQLASLFAWPSYIEGFGIPILEAQASGIPVVSSNTTSMPEVAGDAAVYFDPYDAKGMSEAMMRCLTDELLRGDLVAKGYENIKRFSWDKSAEKLYNIITSL